MQALVISINAPWFALLHIPSPHCGFGYLATTIRTNAIDYILQVQDACVPPLPPIATVASNNAERVPAWINTHCNGKAVSKSIDANQLTIPIHRQHPTMRKSNSAVVCLNAIDRKIPMAFIRTHAIPHR